MPLLPQGVQRAVVTSTDDPERIGRVQVSWTASGTGLWTRRSRPQRGWAEVCTPYGLSGPGPGSTPTVDDVVLVAFEVDDPGRPVVLGRLGPPQDGAEGPSALTHAGHSVALDAEGITLRLADGSAELVLRHGQVTLRSAATMTVSAAGVCTVSGALVRINRESRYAERRPCRGHHRPLRPAPRAGSADRPGRGAAGRGARRHVGVPAARTFGRDEGQHDGAPRRPTGSTDRRHRGLR